MWVRRIHCRTWIEAYKASSASHHVQTPFFCLTLSVRRRRSPAIISTKAFDLKAENGRLLAWTTTNPGGQRHDEQTRMHAHFLLPSILHRCTGTVRKSVDKSSASKLIETSLGLRPEGTSFLIGRWENCPFWFNTCMHEAGTRLVDLEWCSFGLKWTVS
jgi:hypothetical protein